MSLSPDVESAVVATAVRARAAAHELAVATRATKDAALVAMADGLVAARRRDPRRQRRGRRGRRDKGTPEAIVDRLRLDEARIAGRWPTGCARSPGCRTRSARWSAARRSPTASSCARSGCRSGSSASSTRRARTSPPTPPASASRQATPRCCAAPRPRCAPTRPIVAALRTAAAAAGLPEDAVQLVPGEGHEAAKVLMRARGLVDVLIPRGGAGLIRSVVEESTVPVIETGVGNCHVYVDAAGRPRHGARDRAQRQDPPAVGVQRRGVAAGPRGRRRRVPAPGRRGAAGGGRHRARRRARSRREPGVVPATDDDYDAEYLSLDISAAVVPSLEAAVDHIRAPLLGPHRGDRHRLAGRPPAGSPQRSTPRRSWSTPAPGSPTAASSASAPRSASRPRSCTRAARWGCRR